MKLTEKAAWDATNDLLGDRSVTFGKHWSYNFRNDPKRLAFVLSRYKFAAKMAAKGRSVLELGCGEGIGAPILREQALHYTGIDLDEAAILAAKEHFPPEEFTFVYDDFMGKTFGVFDTVVSLDVIEHIYPEFEEVYLKTLYSNLGENGIAVVGTPNVTSAAYASKGSQLGHVNLFSAERLKNTLSRYFHTVFSFGMNDEIVHTGYAPMAHYIFCLCCDKRESI